MNAWESILVAFGGNALLLLLLGWLARSFGSQLLAKDLKRFEAELTATSASTAEHLKHKLQMISLEHQVKFSKLHERRAEVIAKTYELLVDVQRASEAFVSPLENTGESKLVMFNAAMTKASEFYKFFDKNRIFLPRNLCIQIENFVQVMRQEVVGFGIYVQPFNESNQEKIEAWVKASSYFDKEIPVAREALETELRSVLTPPLPSTTQ